MHYPCWSTFPYHYTGSGESAPAAIGKNDHQLLKEGDPEGAYYMPAMADAPLRGANGRHEWFWEPNDEKAIYPLTDLIDMYYKSVGRNATLILGVTPDTAGIVPHLDRVRLKEFGKEIQRLFCNPLIDTSKTVTEIKFNKTEMPNQLVLSEDVSQGQRVRAFRVQAKTRSGWIDVYTGTSIGHKHIAQLDKAVKCRALRLLIDHSINKPLITTFIAYDTATS